MKKLISLLALLLSIVITAGAQSVQVATLTHDGAVSTYSGANALRDAYTAAVDGDVITLSSGSFSSVNFEKRITVRGAGMGVKVDNADPYIAPTILNGSFEIKADGDGNNYFKLEGILSEQTVYLKGVNDAQFSKCKFLWLDYYSGAGGFERTSFVNCVLNRAVICYNANMTFYGCFLRNFAAQSSGSHHTITNCILELSEGYNFSDEPCVVKNSIYLNTNGYESCGNNGTVFNSIWSGPITPYYNSTFKNTLDSHNNTIVPEGTLLFKEGTFYQLTDEAKQYLGDDGTEVGIYGGSLPFNPRLTNPQITKFNVSPKTTADGKLSVDIEVSAN